MIAFETDNAAAGPEIDETIDDCLGGRPAIDIIAKKYIENLGRGRSRKIGLDARKQDIEKVRATVNIANDIDAPAIGYTRRLDCLEKTG
jgi:hypothetical protein